VKDGMKIKGFFLFVQPALNRGEILRPEQVGAQNDKKGIVGAQKEEEAQGPARTSSWSLRVPRQSGRGNPQSPARHEAEVPISLSILDGVGASHYVFLGIALTAVV